MIEPLHGNFSQAGTGEAHASQTLSLWRSGTNELRNDCPY